MEDRSILAMNPQTCGLNLIKLGRPNFDKSAIESTSDINCDRLSCNMLQETCYMPEYRQQAIDMDLRNSV